MMALVYPNPSSGIINLELLVKEENLDRNKLKDPFNVLIYNKNGDKKLDYISSNRSKTFNLHAYEDGNYIMKIFYQDYIIHKNFILKKNTN